MTTLWNLLLVFGLIFPLISWLTVLTSLVERWRHKRNSSPIFIPVIGPVLLTTWVISAQKPHWMIAVFWVADPGTLAFLAASPQMMKDWWHTCSFTRILALSGTEANQSARITLHSTGHYLLKKSWTRPFGETGIVGLGEPGTFTQLDGQYELVSHVGLRRVLQRTNEGTYRVEEEELPNQELRNYSLSGWVLRI